MGRSAIVVLTLVFLWSQATLGSWGRSSGEQRQAGDGAELTNLTLTLINEDRAKNGSPPVMKDSNLSEVAQIYAEYLLRTGFFGHVDPFGRNPEDRARYFGIRTPVSENLAEEESDYEGPAIMVQGCEKNMMNEPAGQINHRFNILNPQNRYVGIGVARAGEKVVVVQEFAESKP